MESKHTLSMEAPAEAPEPHTAYLQLPDGRLAYTDYGGSGELVVMLPGMGALRSEYRYLAPVLHRAGYHAITVDLRGQGESSVPWPAYDVPSVGSDIVSMLEHLDGGPAHVIANSFAPAAAVWAALERPKLIRSLVLINAIARDIKPNPFMRGAFWLMMNNPWRVNTWRKYYRSLYPTSKPADLEVYLDQLTTNLSQPGRFEAARGFANASRQPSEERLPLVKAPVLVVMGSKDPDFADPSAEGHFLSEKTGGKLVMIEGAGHYPQTEMPEATSSAVLEFLKEVSHAVPLAHQS